MTEIPRTPCVSDGGFRRLIPRSLLWAFVAALGVRLAVGCFTFHGFMDPGRQHWEFGFEMGQIARSIVTGHGFGNPYRANTGPTATIPPLFPYLFAGVFAVFGVFTKSAAMTMIGLDSLFSSLTCIPIYFAAKRSFGPRQAVWAAWIWAFYPYSIYFAAGEMWDRCLGALLVTLVFLMALRLENSSGIGGWLGVGFVAGVAALVNPVVLGVLPFLAGWACWRLHRQGKKWGVQAGAMALVIIVVISPWLIRNYRVFHQPVFLKDNFWLEFSIGNVGNTLHWWNGSIHPTNTAAEMEEYQTLGELDYMAEKRSEGLTYVEAHPGIFLWRSVRRFIYVWTGFWSLNREYLREEPLDPLNIFFCSTFTFLALAGMRWAMRQAPQTTWPYVLMLFLFPLVYYITHPEIEYRHPIDPEIVILASCAIVSWLPGFRSASPAARPEQLASRRP